MNDRIRIGGLQIATPLYELVAREIAPGTGIEPDRFWQAFEAIVDDLAPKNRALLEKRDEIQALMDQWHRAHKDQPLDMAEYRAFLADIGCLVPEGEPFCASPASTWPTGCCTVSAPTIR